MSRENYGARKLCQRTLLRIRVRLVHQPTFSRVLATINIAPATFLAIVATAAAAGTVAALVTGRGVIVPVVVVELVFGILLGQQVLGLHVDQFIAFFSNLGLGLLFFFAGYEIDVRRIRGAPLRLALLGWAMSLALAYAIGGALAAAGIVLSLLYTGSSLSTTAIGTLIPILSDTGELRTRFGTYLLAAGAVGEFGPIMLLTLILSAQSTLHNALILIAFVGLAVAVAVLAVRSSERTLPLLVRALEGSAQLLVRWIVVLVFALALIAFELGLDLLLGGFAAGIITREVLRTREIPAFDSKLTAIAFGVFVPFFFVVSGMRLDVAALVASVSGVAKMFLFFVLFLVVRGTPALLLYRRALDARERMALALLTATQLPLVIAITTLATEDGHMRRSTAAALVGAAVLSTLVFPILGLRLRGDVLDEAVLAESPATPT
jgi:Kef-type K+ transport system membrane component KefB